MGPIVTRSIGRAVGSSPNFRETYGTTVVAVARKFTLGSGHPGRTNCTNDQEIIENDLEVSEFIGYNRNYGDQLGQGTHQGSDKIPELAFVRGDPRVDALRKKVGLPE